jgi:hypothetical protein
VVYHDRGYRELSGVSQETNRHRRNRSCATRLISPDWFGDAVGRRRLSGKNNGGSC